MSYELGIPRADLSTYKLSDPLDFGMQVSPVDFFHRGAPQLAADKAPAQEGEAVEMKDVSRNIGAEAIVGFAGSQAA